MHSYFKKLTLKKICNYIRLNFSFVLYILFKSKKRYGFPYSVSIEPTTNCNLACSQCPSGLKTFSRKTGSLDINLFKKITDELSAFLIDLILYFQGEPFLHKQIFEMIDYASKQKKIHTTISTNGHFLNEENTYKTVKSGLDKLIISFDGINQETYKKYRKGGDIDKVLKGIEGLIKRKNELKSKTPYIVIQFIVFNHNEHQIPELKKLAQKLGVDKLELKSAQIYDFENNTDLIPGNNKYSRYKKDKKGKFIIKSKQKNICKRMWFTNVITWDGNVLPCCFDKDAKHVLGNIQKEHFKMINNNSASTEFRRKIRRGRKNIEICKNCTEGLRL